MKLALNLALNNLSFGQVSTLILRTIFDREKLGNSDIDWNLFPIGPVDISCQQASEDFGRWLQSKINNSYQTHTRDIPIFKLWHLNGALESYSNKQTLLTFYELDQPTVIELNVAKNNKLCLSSKYAMDVFQMFGIESNFLPLAFDSYNFKKLDRKFHNDDRITFNLCGKLERRKHHAKIIQLWIKKFGKNPKYALQCAVYNQFLTDQQNNEMLRQIVGDKPFNVNFFPGMKENNIYNDFLNSGDIIIGMSGAEGWGLPEFHSVALGKHALVMNAHSYKTWATNNTVTFVQPSGKVPAYDNMFFKQGDAWNQGNIFDFNEDEFIAACESTIRKVELNRINEKGLELQSLYNKELFLDSIIKLTSN